MTADGIVVTPAAGTFADDIAALAADSRRAGVRNVTVLAERWVDATERFDQPGEQLLVARIGGAVVGVGGITQCPDVPNALRVRRFYVDSDHRRQGVARTLAVPLIEHGLDHTDTITCNAKASDAAPPFWESLGFIPVDTPGITHVFRRR